jgi:hypothetical protein
MFKKVYVPLILALVVALGFSSVAYAASPIPAGAVRRVGTVLSLDKTANTFKLDTLSGGRYTIHVNSSTIYVGISGLAGLKASDRVNVEARMLSDGSWMAERVKVIPLALEQLKQHGVVTAMGKSSFTIMNSQNESYTFKVSSKTHFSGQNVPHLRDLKLGMAVTVTFRGEGTKSLQALDVFVVR